LARWFGKAGGADQGVEVTNLLAGESSCARRFGNLPSMLAAARLDAALVPPTHVGEVPGRRARRMVAHLDGLPLGADPAHGGDGVALGGDTSHATLSGVAMSTGELAHLSVLNTHHPLLEMA